MEVTGEEEEVAIGGEAEEVEAGMGHRHHTKGEGAGECLDHRLEEHILLEALQRNISQAVQV